MIVGQSKGAAEPRSRSIGIGYSSSRSIWAFGVLNENRFLDLAVPSTSITAEHTGRRFEFTWTQPSRIHLDSTLASRVHGTHVERSVVLSTIPRRCVGSVLSLQDRCVVLFFTVGSWQNGPAGLQAKKWARLRAADDFVPPLARSRLDLPPVGWI